MFYTIKSVLLRHYDVLHLIACFYFGILVKKSPENRGILDIFALANVFFI